MTLFAQTQGDFWFPPRSSTVAGDVDSLFYWILAIAIVFFVGIVSAMTWMVIRYRRCPKIAAAPSPQHNTLLEIVWSVIPLLLALMIFYFGFKGYLSIISPPRNTYDIYVTAQKWKWLFTYPTGHVDENLHVPLNRPIRLILTSDDVIHCLFVPDFRVKMDAVPGRYTHLWFEATETGSHALLCAEYCGTAHSDMIASVIVHPPGEFEKWLSNAEKGAASLSPADLGKRLYQTRGCAQCHPIDGRTGIGPGFKGIWGTTQAMKDGANVVVDDNYVKESIFDPQAKIRAGFNPVMPTYKGRLKDSEVSAIIEFLKSLKD